MQSSTQTIHLLSWRIGESLVPLAYFNTLEAVEDSISLSFPAIPFVRKHAVCENGQPNWSEPIRYYYADRTWVTITRLPLLACPQLLDRWNLPIPTVQESQA